MRILMLTHSYPPAFGGIEQHIHNLNTELIKRGHEVTVATLEHNNLPNFEVKNGIKIYRIKGTVHRAASQLYTTERRYAPPFPDPELVLGLRKIIASERPQIVHAHNWMVNSFLPLKAWSKAKLVVTLHDYGLICPKWNLRHNGTVCSGPNLVKCLPCAKEQYGWVKGVPVTLGLKVMSKVERTSVDTFIAVSKAVAQGNRLLEGNYPYEVIPTFLPDTIISERDETDERLNLLPEGPFILFVGALNKIKGVDILLNAYKQLENINVPPLVLIGYETNGQSLAENELPKNVRIMRHWPVRTIMEAWHKSIFGVVPSVWPEPCPTVIIEAMAAGKPVIGSKIGGISDQIINGVTGLLVTPGDSEALASAIANFSENKLLCENMGRAAQIRFKEYGANKVVTSIENLYARLLSKTSKESGILIGTEV